MTERTPPKGQRSVKRSHLIYYLRVFNRSDGQLLGHVVDITHEGIMLVSEKQIPVGSQLDLHMDLPEVIFGKTRLDFGAQSLWSRNDVNPDLFDTGFRLLTIDKQDRAIIERLIDEYGFEDRLT